MTVVYDAPDHLVPIAAEREVVSGLCRMSYILQENPQHSPALAALGVVTDVDPSIFVRREHGVIVRAFQRVVARYGTAALGLVLQELRQEKAWEACRCLEQIYNYGLAPVVGMKATVELVRSAADGRRRYRDNLDTAARIAQGDVQ